MKKIYLLITLLFLISAQSTFADLCDLKLKKEIKSAPFFKGDTITYKLTLTNNGTDTVFSASVNDAFPSAFLQYTSDSTSFGSVYDPFSQVWTIDTVAPNAVFYLYVKTVILKNQLITNVATVIGAPCTPAITDTLTFSAGLCNLALQDTVSKSPYYEDDTLSYRVRLINQGVDTVFSVSLKETYDNINTQYVSDTITAGTPFNTTSNIWLVDTIAPNATVYHYLHSRIINGVPINNDVEVLGSNCFSGTYGGGTGGAGGGGGQGSGASLNCLHYYEGCFDAGNGGGSPIKAATNIPSVFHRLAVTLSSAPVCEGSTVTLNPVATGGAGSNTFTWGASGGPVVNPTIGNSTYSVTVTDINGRNAAATINITLLPAPAPVLIFSKNPACLHETVTIFTGASGTAIWNSTGFGAGFPFGNPGIVTPFSPGSYTYDVTVTDVNGCTGAATSPVLTVNDNPTIYAGGDQTICENTTYLFNSFTNGGTLPYAYSWTPGTNNLTFPTDAQPTISPVTTNETYQVIVTDANGCSASDQAIITVVPVPTGTAIDNISAGICSGATTNISLSADVPGTTFTWVAGLVSGSLTGNSSGSGSTISEIVNNSSNSIPGVIRYTITPTSPGGCPGTAYDVDVTVQPVTDVPLVTPFVSYCKDDVAAQLSAAGVTLTWYDQLLNPIGSVAPTPSTVVAGSTDYYVTDTNNGCESQAAKISVLVNPKDNAAFTYGANTYCSTGGSVVTPASIATPGGTFSFTTISGGGVTGLASFDPSTGAFDVAASDLGKYRVKYQTAGTCSDTSSVVITITNNFDASFTYGSNSYCIQSTVNPLPVFTGTASAGIFSAPVGLNFVSPATGEIDLNSSVPGVYVITNSIAASGSCMAVNASFTVVINGLPIADAGVDTAFCQGQNGVIGRGASASSTYSWVSSPAGAVFTPSDLVSNPNVAPTVTSTFTMTETSTVSGCSKSNSIVVTINPLPAAPVVSSPVDYCANATAVDLSSSVSGTTLTYYGPNSTTANPSLTAPTPATVIVGTDTYYVTQTDIKGCISPQASIIVNTNAIDVATISYPSAQYCTGASTNPVAIITGKTGGTFSVLPAVTGFDVTTGEIPLANTTAGQCYIVTYNTAGTSGNCHITTNFQVCIIGTPKANFTYGTFCKDTINVLPVISAGSLTGGTFKLFPVSQTGIDVDSISGSINLSGFPNTYTVRHFIPYNSTTGCPSSLFDSTITIKPLPLAVIADTTMRKVCYQSSVVLKADAFVSNSSYLWLKNGLPTTITVDSIKVDSTGTYSVIANTLTCGSDTSFSVKVVVNTAIDLTATTISNVNCFGGADGTIQTNVSGGVRPFSFEWSTPERSKKDNIFGLSAGTYTVTVTDGFNCAKIDSFVVTQPATKLNVIVTSTPALCFGQNNGFAKATAQGGVLPYTYLWNDAAATTDSALMNINAGLYVVTVSDSKGCSLTASTTVTEPNSIGLTGKTVPVSCSGKQDGKAYISATGGTNTGYTYLWQYDGSVADSLTNLFAGVYIVQITDNATTGCYVYDTITVAEPLAITLKSTVKNVKCKNDGDGEISIVATGGNGGYTYKWKAPITATTEVLKGLSPGAYTVTVTDAKGCSKTKSSSISQPSQVLRDSLTHVDIACSGGTDGKAKVFALGGVPPYKYLWSNNAKTDQITNLPNGKYTVLVTDSNGCTAAEFVNIIVPSPIVTTTYSQNASPGAKDGKAYVKVEGGKSPYIYLWNDSIAQTNDTLLNVRSGTYTLKVTDANGCFNFVSVFVDENITGISDIVLQNSVSVYPNPNEGLFMVTISQENIKVSDIRIYSVEGAIVYERQLNSFDKLVNTAIDLNKFSAGIYYMQVNTNSGIIRKKVVVQK